MFTDTEGIVLKSIKAANGRRMIVLFTVKYGKISAGTSIGEKTRGKQAAAVKPFTYGRYELFKGRETFNINGAETIRTHYAIGSDVDKYACASYALEFTDRLLEEGQPDYRLFHLFTDFLKMLEARPKKPETLLLGYLANAMTAEGVAPDLSACASCGAELTRGNTPAVFDVPAGSILCSGCAPKPEERAANANSALIYDLSFGKLEVLRYLFEKPLSSLEKVALDDALAEEIRGILKRYSEDHLGIGQLKSEAFMTLPAGAPGTP